MEKHYQALRIIGIVYKVFGAIVAVMTILAILGICATSVLGGAAVGSVARELGGDTGLSSFFSGVLGGLMGSVLAAIYGGGLAVTLYALGEGVYLLLALEENTRATVTLLQQQASTHTLTPHSE